MEATTVHQLFLTENETTRWDETVVQVLICKDKMLIKYCYIPHMLHHRAAVFNENKISYELL
jgi:hypothetical protein